MPDLPIDMDFESVERQYGVRAGGGVDPEQVFNRRWALALLDRVLSGLRAELDAAGQGDRFQVLVPFVTGEPDAISFRKAGERLGISEGAARVAAHRLKQRYKQAVREEVAATVADESETAAELRYLMRVLAG